MKGWQLGALRALGCFPPSSPPTKNAEQGEKGAKGAQKTLQEEKGAKAAAVLLCLKALGTSPPHK